MVQAIVNNFNNISDVMKDKSLQFTGVDKKLGFGTKDFDNFFEDKVNSLNESNRIADLHKKDGSEEINLQKILKKARHEANAENSLDLTLDKDINEVINQFKEFIESSTEDGKIVIDEEMLEKLKKVFDESELKILFTQYLATMNLESVQDISLKEGLSTLKEKISAMLENTEVEAPETKDILDILEENAIEDLETVTKQENDLALDADMLEDLNIESIEAETSSTGGENLMQNQSAEEQGIKAMLSQETDSFEISLGKIANSQVSQSVTSKTADVSPSRILEQITKQLENLQTNSKVNIVLNPEALGKVNVQLMSTKTGLAAQFTVNTAEARDLLMKGIDGLKESLLSYGVSVDNVSVKLNETQESQYNADWTEQDGSRGGYKGDGQPSKEEKEKGLFEQTMAQANFIVNGNV